MGTDPARSDARHALAAIVAAPDLGPQVLSNPGILANFLSDYLPGSPRETGPLLAAAQAGVAGTLTDHARRGMDMASAIRITAANLATHTGYSPDVAMWAVSEYAVALGLSDGDRLPVLAPASQRTSTGEARLEHTTDRSQPAEDITASRKPRRRRRWPLVAGGVVVVLAAGIPGGAALYYEHVHASSPAASGGSRPRNSPSRSGAASPSPSTSVAASSGLWTSPRLVMTGDSLGAVTTGMTLGQASAAAGVQLTQVGDGYAYPGGTSGPLGVNGDPVACVFADVGGPEVTTPEGFVLGQDVATLRSVYGSRLRYVPAGATSNQGIPSPPEYVVSYAQGRITFAVHDGRVAWMRAGSAADNC